MNKNVIRKTLIITSLILLLLALPLLYSCNNKKTTDDPIAGTWISSDGQILVIGNDGVIISYFDDPNSSEKYFWEKDPSSNDIIIYQHNDAFEGNKSLINRARLVSETRLRFGVSNIDIIYLNKKISYKE